MITASIAFVIVLSMSTVAEFEQVGRVCLSQQEKEIVLRRLRDQLRDGDSAMLIGYSDRREPNSNRDTSDCLDASFSIPPSLEGHELVGVQRALQVYAVAHAAGLPGFSGPPLILTSEDEAPISVVEGSVVIVGRRAFGRSDFSRRVDLHVEPPTQDCPSCPDCELTEPPPEIYVDVVNPPGPDAGVSIVPLQIAGWSQLALGLTTTALGGVFLVAASKQRNASLTANPEERALALELDGYRYVRSGGWALAVGSGLLVGGAVALTIAHLAKNDRKRRKKSRVRMSTGLEGLVLQW